MVIDSITIKNFRGFEGAHTIKLNHGINCFIGINGAGKSSIIHAIASALQHIPYGFFNKQKSHPYEYSLLASDVNFASTYLEIELIVTYDSKNFKINIFKEKDLESYQLRGDYNELVEAVKIKNTSYPVFSGINLKSKIKPDFHGIDNVFSKPEYLDLLKLIPSLKGYVNAFNPSMDSYLENIKWFIDIENIENEEIRRKFETIKEHPDRLKSALEYQKKELVVLRNTLKSVFNILGGNEYKDLKAKRTGQIINTNSQFLDEIELVKDRQSLKLSQLSDGELTIFLYIFDLVRRITQLNPQITNTLLQEGVVLIDEIDLHLHPQWQLNILNALKESFPLIQFIVTTHSALVINQIKESHIIIVKDFKFYQSDKNQFYGKDVNFLIDFVFDSSSRPVKIKEKLEEANKLLDKDPPQINSAKQIYNELLSQLGNDDSSVQSLETQIAFQE